jgi:hypothetical protein
MKRLTDTEIAMIHANPLRYYPHMIHTVAFQRAIRIIKKQLAADGVRIGDVTSRDLKIWANEYLQAHRSELIEATIEWVRGDPGFMKLGESEARRRAKAQTDNSSPPTEGHNPSSIMTTPT